MMASSTGSGGAVAAAITLSSLPSQAVRSGSDKRRRFSIRQRYEIELVL
jgi:hypothetical protein